MATIDEERISEAGWKRYGGRVDIGFVRRHFAVPPLPLLAGTAPEGAVKDVMSATGEAF